MVLSVVYVSCSHMPQGNTYNPGHTSTPQVDESNQNAPDSNIADANASSTPSNNTATATSEGDNSNNQDASQATSDEKVGIVNWVSYVSIVLSLLAIVLVSYLILVVKRNDKNKFKNIHKVLTKSLYEEDDVYRRIVAIIDSKKPIIPKSLTHREVEVMIGEFIKSKMFADILIKFHSEQIATIVSKPAIENTNYATQSAPQIPVVPRETYTIYARESSSMVLSSIQDSYQRGKSLYKLEMSSPNASTAEISVCVEQSDVKQRILKLDSQYLEPICSVSRLSSDPTDVIIKATGTAERVGNEWKVVKPIMVEMK